MKTLIEEMNREVANFGVFYVKLHHYHWNVVGMTFYQLHDLFEKLYDEVAGHMDAVAERVLMLEGRPVASMKEFLTIATLKEASGNEVVMEMVNQTIYDMMTIESELTEIIKLAQNSADGVTADLILRIQGNLQKHLWMLKALEK
jgi:starvation-inducible DNA-binding protein